MNIFERFVTLRTEFLIRKQELEALAIEVRKELSFGDSELEDFAPFPNVRALPEGPKLGRKVLALPNPHHPAYKHGGAVKDLVLKAIKDGVRGRARAIATAINRPIGGVICALQTLTNSGEIVRVERGLYGIPTVFTKEN